MSNESQKPMVAAEPEIGRNDVGHSEMHDKSKGGTQVSPKELALQIEMANQQIAALTKQVKDLTAKNSESSVISQLTELLSHAVPVQRSGPTEADNINRSKDYREFANNVDGQYVLDAQTRLTSFRKERKMPISIPKGLAPQFGDALTISVNGVRVSIPVDGKTYYINETHWRHARERMAKLDRIANSDKPTVIETEA